MAGPGRPWLEADVHDAAVWADGATAPVLTDREVAGVPADHRDIDAALVARRRPHVDRDVVGPEPGRVVARPSHHAWRDLLFLDRVADPDLTEGRRAAPPVGIAAVALERDPDRRDPRALAADVADLVVAELRAAEAEPR
jgi:hypothetical protein